MVSGTNRKIKVVWLCHFSNKEFKDHFNTPHINDFAPWISMLIEYFENNNEIDLCIIAPNIFTNQDHIFIKKGIVFNFYKPIPIVKNYRYLNKVYHLLRIDYLTNFYWIKYKIKKIIGQLNPDIIHLHGAENPYYSAGILPLMNKYPTLITIQGFIRQTSERNYISQNRIKIEEKILNTFNNFGVRTKEMTKTILEINPNANLFFHNYPILHPTIFKNNIGKYEQYDCIFFARICRDKGIEDLLQAISKIKISRPTITLLIIGEINNSYYKFINQLITKLEIQDNIIWKGFVTDQDTIYEHAFQSKICVLPTLHDIIPGTIIESMLMKLPVISYAVGGIPEINETDERIVLVEKGNIDLLTAKILYLLDDNDKRVSLSEKAFLYAKDKFNNINIVSDITNSYEKIIKTKQSK